MVGGDYKVLQSPLLREDSSVWIFTDNEVFAGLAEVLMSAPTEYFIRSQPNVFLPAIG